MCVFVPLYPSLTHTHIHIHTYIYPNTRTHARPTKDHIGGHIRSSLHFPSRGLDATMPTLLRQLADKDTVVFHCALSQQRGPSAALQYLRERGQQQQEEEEKGEESKGEGKEEDGEDKLTAEKKKEEKQKKTQQKVYVLDRGFVGWQEVYGPDERLTEAWVKEIWEDGY